MKKIISLFKRDYEATRLVYNEIVPGAEWVIAGEGVATEKFDGTACMVRDHVLYKRYDRKLIRRSQHKLKIPNVSYVPEDFKPAPAGWEPCEDMPDFNTGHWPGWIPVGQGPEDKWHREAFSHNCNLADGTYELVGPKIRGNPHNYHAHRLIKHGTFGIPGNPCTFAELKDWFRDHEVEGIVWHHEDGRMVKIKRRDFGFTWPPGKKGY